MTTPEMFYELILFFFSNVWIYLGLIFLIITVRGDITRGFKAVQNFFSKARANYKEKIKERKTFADTKKQFQKEN